MFAHSHCVVYPSVNREAFGLVVAEAMSHGTPVLVPDYGGITEVMRDGDRAGGLTFHAWDSGDLARQLESLLTNATLHRELAGNARPLAERFTADHMADRVLQHLGILDRKGRSQSDGGISRVA
ncbi:glycosyltransferase [Azotobacter sp. CWF10]